MTAESDAPIVLIGTYNDGQRNVSAVRWDGTDICEQVIRQFTEGKVHWNHKHTALGQMREGAFWHISVDSWIVQRDAELMIVPNHIFQPTYRQIA